MNGLDLFSGIGGAALALSRYVRPVAYCEIDRAAQAILLTRMASGDIPTAPIWDDVSTLRGRDIPYKIDIITGGFPCQDISLAGRGGGLEGERSGLFYEITRLAGELKPRFLFLENVPAITTRGGTEVVRTLASMGYDCRWCIISAASVGAPHKRDRWWLLAHAHGTDGGIQQKPEQRQEAFNPCGNGSEKSVAHSNGPRLQTPWPQQQTTGHQQFTPRWDITKSPVFGVAHGLPNRAHRIRGLGNAWVPAQACKAFELLMFGY